MNFEIHPRLLRSGIAVSHISGCHILLKNESAFPWFIIVPEVAEGIEDLHQLELGRLNEVMAVVHVVSRFVDEFFKPEKLNVGCIGNQVRQMHIHVIGRTINDPAWPGVVWGANFQKCPYEPDAIKKIQSAFLDFLKTSGA